MTDPERREATAGERVAVKDSAIRLCALLARHFGEGLDRLTLWDRIGSAWEVALSKVGGDPDLFRLASLLLEHVQADPAAAARCDGLAGLYAEWEGWPDETRHAFLAYCRAHRYPLLAFGRQKWERMKEEAKAGRGSEAKS